MLPEGYGWVYILHTTCGGDSFSSMIKVEMLDVICNKTLLLSFSLSISFSWFAITPWYFKYFKTYRTVRLRAWCSFSAIYSLDQWKGAETLKCKYLDACYNRVECFFLLTTCLINVWIQATEGAANHSGCWYLLGWSKAILPGFWKTCHTWCIQILYRYWFLPLNDSWILALVLVLFLRPIIKIIVVIIFPAAATTVYCCCCKYNQGAN